MHARVSCLALLLALAGGPEDAAGRTWRVTPEGGEPAIDAAMDSAAVGDTVLVAPGEYVIARVQVANGIVFRSEAGPLQTRFREIPQFQGGGLQCEDINAATEISGLWFEGFTEPGFEGSGAIYIRDSNNVYVRGCVFAGNHKGGLSVYSGSVWLENNTFVDNRYSVNGSNNASGIAIHNIFWDDALIYSGNVFLILGCNDMLDIAGHSQSNFSLDPQFCGSQNYQIADSSPCAPGNSPMGATCGLVGALAPGCATTTVETRTWGAIKALYRD